MLLPAANGKAIEEDTSIGKTGTEFSGDDHDGRLSDKKLPANGV